MVEALIQRIPIVTNYKVDCINWDIFYKKKNILFCDGTTKNYINILNDTRSKKILFFENDLQIFDSKYCFKQLIESIC